jgi:hypothetical protein
MGTLAGLCAELEGLIARKGGQQDSQKKEGSPMTGLQGCSEMNHTEAITIESLCFPDSPLLPYSAT